VAIWYFSRPATPDQLYTRISAAAAGEETRELLNVEDEIDEFLERFPDDARQREVQSLREELDLYRRDRRYERQAKMRRTKEPVHPVEQAYLKAIRLAREDPCEALAQLQALLQVYEGMDVGDDEDLQSCLTLAREKATELSEPAKQMAKRNLSLLQDRLDAADQLADSDPQTAREIYRGIITLYRDNGWAEPAVTRARTASQ
jgi:hypothetical protein